MSNKLDKIRISSIMLFFGSILTLLLGILSLTLGMFMMFNLDGLDIESKGDFAKGICLIFIFSILFFYASFQNKVVFIDDKFVYLKGLFFIKKIEKSDVKRVSRKVTLMSLFWKSNVFIVEYLNNNLSIKKFEFQPSKTNFEIFNSFKEEINTEAN